MNMTYDGMGIVTESGPNFESSPGVERSVYDMISCYREVFREKKLQGRQTVLDSFLKRELTFTRKISHSRALLSVRKCSLYTLYMFCKKF
jgi:hypothetical protein